MAHRTFKHLLGETSLERKCRFLLGSSVFALVTISFFLSGRQAEALLLEQSRQTARRLVNPVLLERHYRSGQFVNRTTSDQFEQLAESFQQQDDLPKYDGRIIDLAGASSPLDAFETAAIEQFRRSAAAAGPGSSRPFTFPDGSPREQARTSASGTWYEYAQAVPFGRSCVGCHDHRTVAGKEATVRAGDLACVVLIKLPFDQTNRDINQNRAILISAALVTAIVAMFASYAIVRYVIVKPVKHLRDVSDAIAAGKLNIRAQIQTGDEFEEIARNLATVQQELRDGKP